MLSYFLDPTGRGEPTPRRLTLMPSEDLRAVEFLISCPLYIGIDTMRDLFDVHECPVCVLDWIDTPLVNLRGIVNPSPNFHKIGMFLKETSKLCYLVITNK